MFGMTETATAYRLGILSHDGTCSVVAVSDHDKGSEYVWVTFGEVTPNGFLPCYATTPVRTEDVHYVIL